ncbi:hypothetical protein WJX73_000544 [Symbiochloris irregularis]|uniref:Uncharacterized protein n=1 Tax=Symbiochloris irregularis TaxID=706552 RepID=A0AAW1PJL4_9CHLO
MGDYRKGDLVWYRQRDGTVEEAKVVSVDKSVQPWSYGVQLGQAILVPAHSTSLCRSLAQSAPLSLSLFGEEEGEPSADAQLPSLAVGQPWGGLPSPSYQHLQVTHAVVSDFALA